MHQEVLTCKDKKGVQVHFRPQNTLRELLVAPKDKMKKVWTSVEWSINFPVQTVYPHTLRKQKRSLGTRLSEHRKAPPLQNTGHNIPSDQVQIIGKDPA